MKQFCTPVLNVKRCPLKWSVTDSGRALDGAWRDLSKAICSALITQECVVHRSLEWMRLLDGPGQSLLMQCCTDSLHDVVKSMELLNLSQKAKSHVLMLRGLLAFELMLHCLKMRHNVDHGFTDRFAFPSCVFSSCGVRQIFLAAGM